MVTVTVTDHGDGTGYSTGNSYGNSNEVTVTVAVTDAVTVAVMVMVIVMVTVTTCAVTGKVLQAVCCVVPLPCDKELVDNERREGTSCTQGEAEK